ncbi:hypothetical protein [Kitasatospora sp. GP82]|uniref:hypothetical protein n=1 Tax=Kitasatospora sp. GP82 TaxID=3035089 RepID=UPI002475AD09|nr:hypothetical protein [Kitasatospora sp. GP82]MDH6124901.1 hypothetical protein [Kitasatospora sp. GP82]
MYTCEYATGVHAAASTAGLPARSVARALADTVRRLYRNGQLTERQAGLLAAGKESEPTG